MKQTLIDYLNKNRNAIVYVLDKTNPEYSGFSSGNVYRLQNYCGETFIQGGYCNDLDDTSLQSLERDAGFETIFDIKTLLKEEEWDNFLVFPKQKNTKKKKILYKVIKLEDMYLSCDTYFGAPFTTYVNLFKDRKDDIPLIFEKNDEGKYINDHNFELNEYIENIKKDTGLWFRAVNIVAKQK